MAGLAMMLAIAGQTGALSPFQSIFLTLTSPIESVITGIFGPVANLLSDAGRLHDLEQENRDLRVRNEDLQNQVTNLKGDAERVKELEGLLSILQGATSGTRLPANVVARDSSAGQDVISIDQGSGNGVKVGMVVLSSQGSLIGTVTKVFKDQAFVRLVTDSRSKVNAEVVESSSINGTVQGSISRSLTFGLAQGDIKVGNTVMTSGLGGNYPPGIPIGRVTEVTGGQQELYPVVRLEPLVRLSTARTVLVLTSFTPQRITLDAP
jgi:rod shape-determining protein MreC